MNAQDKAQLQQLRHSARKVVREIGAAAQIIDDSHIGVNAALYNHIMQAYDMACVHLLAIDPEGAAEFIKRTYGPSFRQTEVRK